MVLASAVVLVPLLVILFTSLKTRKEALGTGPLDLPSNWFNFENFRIAFTQGHMMPAFLNTGVILLVSVTGTVVIGSMTAYAIDRFEFRLKAVVMGAFLLASLVPSVTTQVATFQIVNNLGAFNTRWAPILLYLGTDIISIYIFLQFIRSIPVSLDEAARLDGANSFTIYWRIILPMLKPAIATVVIVKGVTVYNDFFIPFLYMPSTDLGTISTSLFRFQGPFGVNWEIISAGAILVILPTLIVFLALQRLIYAGFAAGSTK
ncbi:carbohydrate ABC transporter permease [Kitasatospora sp. NA04385]|uniref:carbohydrate ABC transporter permease n=1 Tax=Kitasatospora sp. NA04385 TaxID=2742135 RepID=UPI0020CABC74|nr:carbohydrate ABC transporter permease [Kitasatospora sp. NA04385]